MTEHAWWRMRATNQTNDFEGLIVGTSRTVVTGGESARLHLADHSPTPTVGESDRGGCEQDHGERPAVGAGSSLTYAQPSASVEPLASSTSTAHSSTHSCPFCAGCCSSVGNDAQPVHLGGRQDDTWQGVIGKGLGGSR